MAQTGVIESHAGQVLGIAHAFAGFLVPTVGHGAPQIAVNVFHGLFSAGVGHGGGRCGNIGFHGVGQGVHARGGGQGRGHAHHQQGIVNGHAGRAAPVHNGHLHLAGRVGDDAKARHFRSRAGGGVDGHIGREGPGGLVHPFIIMNFAAIAGQKAHALAAVVRAAAAQGDQAVAFFPVVDIKSGFHIFIRGVGHGLIKNGVLHARAVENIGNLLQNADGDNALVCDDQGFGAANAFQTGRDISGTAFAHQRDVGDEEGSNLPHMHAFDIGTHV